jgi:hypothetical protein
MAMTAQTKLIWWLLLISALAMMLWKCQAASPSQGAGAKALLSGVKSGSMPLPKATIGPVTTNTWYFAATATDTNGLTSDYSNEVTTNLPSTIKTVTLLWNPSPSSNIAGYNVFKGKVSGIYTNKYAAGTNLTLEIPLSSPLPSNRVVTLKPMVATNLSGPWTVFTNWPSVTWTNPLGNRWFKLAVTETNL